MSRAFSSWKEILNIIEIISLFTVCANKTRLTPPHCIEVPVPRQDNGYVYTTFYWKACTMAGQWLCIHHILLKGLDQGRTVVMYTPHFIERPGPRQDNGYVNVCLGYRFCTFIRFCKWILELFLTIWYCFLISLLTFTFFLACLKKVKAI
jgi:hypothetical protein